MNRNNRKGNTMTQEINITTAGFGEAIAYVLNAHTDACNKFPSWPVDQVYATAILAEESGETVQAALRHHWDSGSLNEIIMEAAQTGAMAIRVIQGALLAQAEAGDQRKYVDWYQMAPEKVVAIRSCAMVLDVAEQRGRDNAYKQLEAVYQDEYPEGEYLDKKSWKLIRSTLKGELT
jgi:hypothetical protein